MDHELQKRAVGDLVFAHQAEFMKYCNKYLGGPLKKGEARAALVPLDGFLEVESHVSKTPDGRYRVNLIVSGESNGFFVVSETPLPGGDELKAGDLVLWQAFGKPSIFSKAKISKYTGDKRSNWIGFVVAKIAPVLRADGQFEVLSRYQ
jgi:hypothetical protein